MRKPSGWRPAARLLLAVGALAGAAGCDAFSPSPKASELHPVSGGDQRDTVRATLATALVVQAATSGGDGVKGQELLFRASNGGSVSPASARTDGEGRAQVTWTLGSQAGIQTLTVMLGRDTTVTTTFHATADPGALAGIEPAEGNGQSGAALRPLPQPVSFRARDAYGNGKPGVPMTFAVVRGGGTLASASGTTGADGRAGTGWTLGTLEIDQRITATAASFTATGAATVDTTRAVFLSLPDSAGIGDTVNAAVRVNLSGLGTQRRGFVSATLNWSGVTLRAVSIPIRDSKEQGTSYIPTVGAAPVTVAVSRARNDLASETAFTVRFVVQGRTAPGDVPISLSVLSLLGAGTIDDLRGSVSVVGDVIRIR